MRSGEPMDHDRRRFLARCLSGGAAALAANLVPRSVWAAEAGTRMGTGEPSATARGAALSRAVHQIVDFPRVLEDPYALPILGPVRNSELQAAVDYQSRPLRASIVMRSRYAEDRLAAAVARGVRQYVILGAGLDTFACRNPHAGLGLRVFEVDHPATQRYKRVRLDEAGIASPPGLTFVPIDFETQKLPHELASAGFRFDEPAFFSLLGVVIYLTDSAVMDTMRVVGSCAPGSEIAFSFSVPDDLLTEAQRTARHRSMAQVAALGEPWITFYDPSVLADAMRARGFNTIDVLGPPDANRTYFADRSDGLRVSSGHMMAARI